MLYSYSICLSVYLFIYEYVCVFLSIYIACLNIYGTHVTANDLFNNNVEFFLVSDLKKVYYINY